MAQMVEQRVCDQKVAESHLDSRTWQCVVAGLEKTLNSYFKL